MFSFFKKKKIEQADRRTDELAVFFEDYPVGSKWKFMGHEMVVMRNSLWFGDRAIPGLLLAYVDRKGEICEVEILKFQAKKVLEKIT